MRPSLLRDQNDVQRVSSSRKFCLSPSYFREKPRKTSPKMVHSKGTNILHLWKQNIIPSKLLTWWQSLSLDACSACLSHCIVALQFTVSDHSASHSLQLGLPGSPSYNEVATGRFQSNNLLSVCHRCTINISNQHYSPRRNLKCFTKIRKCSQRPVEVSHWSVTRKALV